MKLLLNVLTVISTTDPDDARKRKILNILLAGVVIAAILAIAFINNIYQHGRAGITGC